MEAPSSWLLYSSDRTLAVSDDFLAFSTDDMSQAQFVYRLPERISVPETWRPFIQEAMVPLSGKWHLGIKI